MIVVVAGTRTVKNTPENRWLVLTACHASGFFAGDTHVVHGGARGVDAIAHELFDGVLPVTAYPVTRDDWERHGRRAGPLRNRVMAKVAAAAVVIWSGDRKRSPGSANMIDEMRKLGKPVYEHVLGVTKYG